MYLPNKKSTATNTTTPPPVEELSPSKHHVGHRNKAACEITPKIQVRFQILELFHHHPNFMSTHLSNLLSRNDHDYVIYIPKTIVVPYICIVASEPTFEKISQFQMPSTFQPGMVELVGSSNGLFCLTHLRNYKSLVNVVYLWNPSIRNYNYMLLHSDLRITTRIMTTRL